jgi:hypothetical protein
MWNKKWEELKRYFREWPEKSWAWRWRNLENLIDDPVDNVKHKLHGLKIGPWRIRLPKWLMRGSGDPTK